MNWKIESRLSLEEVCAYDIGLDFDYNARYNEEQLLENWASFGLKIYNSNFGQIEASFDGNDHAFCGWIEGGKYILCGKEELVLCEIGKEHIYEALDNLIRLELGFPVTYRRELFAGRFEREVIIFE